MTLGEALRILRGHWVTVALTAALATVVAVAVAFLTPPQYSATTNIFIATPDSHSPDEAFAVSRFAQGRAVAYRDLITSESLATRTATRLHLTSSPRELAHKVRATLTPDSVVLKLSVTDGSPQEAIKLVNALSDDFVRMVKDLETPVDGGTPIARAVVTKSANDAVWVSPDRRAIIAFGMLAGLLLGGLVALMRGSRKPRVPAVDSAADSGADAALEREHLDMTGETYPGLVELHPAAGDEVLR